MTTQDAGVRAPWASRESLVLAQRHVEHDLHLVDDGTTTRITVEPGNGCRLVGVAGWDAFPLRVEVALVTEAYAVLGEPIGREYAPGDPAGWPRRDPRPDLVGDTAAYGPVEHPAHGRAWRELIVPRGDLVAGGGRAAARRSVGVRVAPVARAAARRLRDRSPHHRARGRLRARPVHLHKGCYRGQETIARVHDGRDGRSPAPGRVSGIPGARAAPTLDGRQVGHLTSVARHHEDGLIALALVKRNTPVDAVLASDSVSAAQTVVVAP